MMPSGLRHWAFSLTRGRHSRRGWPVALLPQDRETDGIRRRRAFSARQVMDCEELIVNKTVAEKRTLTLAVEGRSPRAEGFPEAISTPRFLSDLTAGGI